MADATRKPQVILWQGCIYPKPCGGGCGKKLTEGYAIDGIAYCNDPCGHDIIADAQSRWVGINLGSPE